MSRTYNLRYVWDEITHDWYLMLAQNPVYIGLYSITRQGISTVSSSIEGIPLQTCIECLVMCRYRTHSQYRPHSDPSIPSCDNLLTGHPHAIWVSLFHVPNGFAMWHETSARCRASRSVKQSRSAWVLGTLCRFCKIACLRGKLPFGLRRVITLTAWGKIATRKGWAFAS